MRGIGDLPGALGLGAVGAIAAACGALLALALPADVLRWIFAALVALVGLRLIRDARAEQA